MTLGVGNIDQKLLYKKIRKSLYNLGSYHKNSLWVIFFETLGKISRKSKKAEWDKHSMKNVSP